MDFVLRHYYKLVLPLLIAAMFGITQVPSKALALFTVPTFGELHPAPGDSGPVPGLRFAVVQFGSATVTSGMRIANVQVGKRLYHITNVLWSGDTCGLPPVTTSDTITVPGGLVKIPELPDINSSDIYFIVLRADGFPLAGPHGYFKVTAPVGEQSVVYPADASGDGIFSDGFSTSECAEVYTP